MNNKTENPGGKTNETEPRGKKPYISVQQIYNKAVKNIQQGNHAAKTGQSNAKNERSRSYTTHKKSVKTNFKKLNIRPKLLNQKEIIGSE